MLSRYSDSDADAFIERYSAQFGVDLALRIYTSRLLGQEPRLVLHGGGNTSVKTQVTDFIGDRVDVLYVKGSGWDLGAIEPVGFPACRLNYLRRLCEKSAMTDEEMVSLLRSQMLDPKSPTPSVEALLHAYLPAKFVDHTHANAVLAVVDQPDSEARIQELYGDDAIFIPYVMPGFVLARRIAEEWAARGGETKASIMVLDKHGIFTWGETAKESYEKMIEAVTRAEDYMARKGGPAVSSPVNPKRPTETELARLAEDLRGAVSRASRRHFIGSLRTSEKLVEFTLRGDVEKLAGIGCITPDHVIRTKPWPLVLTKAPTEEGFCEYVDTALSEYASRYDSYFKRGVTSRGVNKTPLDPFPRVILVRGYGAFTLGKTLSDAQVAADVYEHTVEVIGQAARLSEYRPVSELDLFDVEYWSLEQAKLGKAAPETFASRVAFVTGAASGIGRATAEAFLARGAHVILADKNETSLHALHGGLAKKYGNRMAPVPCDVTSAEDVRRAFDTAALAFGGVDIVVSNAGNAWTGSLHTNHGEQAFRKSMELNLFSHQHVARAAAERMLRQGTAGVLLFNASKSAFNQGPDFGPYAVPKAALLSLMRQYAVDLGPKGIRANAVNADRIRTDLFQPSMLEARASARGVSVDEYFRNNLLNRETTAEDVAEAFVYLATASGTTGCVITVDGGNAAAFPR